MMNGTNDLVVIAKTWLQREEQFPIDFDEIWERAGFTRRDNAQRHFSSVIHKFFLSKDLDFSSFQRESSGGRPSTSWRMTIGAAKRFLASAQTQEGFAIIDALIKAEEELTAIKANIETHVAGLVDQRITAMIPVMIEKVTSGVLAAITPLLTQNQITAPAQTRGLSMRELVAKSRTLVSWHDSIHQNYGYDHVQAARSFGKIVKTAARNAGALIGKQNGVEVYDESKLLEIVEKASAPMASFSRRNRNRYRPAPGQLELGFSPTFSRN